MHTIRPEAQILLRAAQNQTIESQGLSQNLNWNDLFKTAHFNGMIPLLYKNLQNPKSVPPEFAARLQTQMERINAKNLYLSNELVRILDLLETNKIPVIPYKGPALAKRLYGNLGLRHFVDLDVLVLKKDVLRVKELLLTNGYRPKTEILNMTPAQEQAFLGFQYSYDFDHLTAGHQLEIHWEIVPRTFSLMLNYEEIWKNAVPSSYNGIKTLAIAPEDLILILCISGAKHVWDRLSRISDIAETLKCFPDLNWDQIEQKAIQSGSKRILFLGLRLAADLLNAPLDLSTRHKAERDTAISSLMETIVDDLFTEPEKRQGFLKQEDQFQIMHVKMRERFRDQLRYCALVALTPSVGEWSAVKLPASLYFGYRIVRIVRLFWKSFRRILASSFR